MNQYNVLIAELKVRIRQAWGADFLISAGRPKTPFPNNSSFAVISMPEPVTSSGSGRAAVREWKFQVIGVFPYVDSEDSEVVSMNKIDLLHQSLEPYDEISVPTADAPFAGICDEHFVTSFAPMEEEMDDNFVGCVIDFQCRTKVYV